MRGLYAIVDPEHCAGRDPRRVAEAILRGGCAALQLRAKGPVTDPDLIALGRELAALCRSHGVPFVLNDRVDLAAAIAPDGVHLGQGDLPLEAARAQLGSTVSLTLSTHDLEQAQDAVRRGADGIGFGPVFATQTKLRVEPVVGVAALAQVCSMVSVPVIAIGGITHANVREVARAGAPLAAAIGAVCTAPDPEAAARALHAAMQGVQ